MRSDQRQDAAPSKCFRRAGIDGARQLVAEYAFELEGIPRTIHLRVYERLQGDGFEIEQSHYLQTPGMAVPGFAEGQRYRSIADALDAVLEGFMASYERAVGAGHAPSSAWLLPDRDH